MSIKIAIIEDDAGMRAILSDWITYEPDLELCAVCSNVESALAGIRAAAPEVVLMDINLHGQSGIHCIQKLKPVMPETQFVVVTVFEDSDHIFDALSAGATGYLLKQMRREELLASIRQVHSGGSPMSSYIARKVVQWFQRPPMPRPVCRETLSAREQEILRLLARGLAYKQMADQLNLSIGTINTHVRRIYQKLQVSSRAEAVAIFAPFPSEPQCPGRHTD